ncbi:MAG: toll/interleukin-1 receptor domain-containing protein [Terracidiphilus sp.]
MPFDVFVSHSSKDRLVANALCARLEAAGIRCWIAPRDIVAGTSYGESIIEAIHSVKVMVLVLSANANSSGHIPKEVERAVSNGVAILPFRIEDVPPGKSLDYFIGSVHWLDALTPPLEKHLDELVETVQKLITPPTAFPAAGVLQSAPANSSALRPMTPARAGNAIPSKKLWIGIAAVVVVAAILFGFILLRPKPPGPISPTVNPSPNPAVVSPTPGPTPSPGPSTTADPIVGCYHWFNNGSVFIHSSGVIQGGPFTGHWRLVNAAQRKYTFTWPEAIDTVTITSDQRSLSGSNQYGYPIAATRVASTFGIIGTWNMSNNVPLVVSTNGVFSAGTFSGTWQTVDASRGIYTLTWPDPVDSVTLSADDQTISGANQYGVATSGTRVEPCNVN